MESSLELHEGLDLAIDLDLVDSLLLEHLLNLLVKGLYRLLQIG